MAQIDTLLKMLREKKGSDLHLSPRNPPMGRISGELVPLDPNPLTAQMTENYLFEIMLEHQCQEYKETHDVDFAYSVEELQTRFRANVFLGRLGISGVLRLIPTQIKTVQQLGLPDAVLRFCDLSKGLVLVTGGTGSGKSTTLAALVDHINRTAKSHILTIEDPIEFVHASQKSLVNQREIGHHTNSFATALKAALREDPDVILVGEMRDLETIELAITAAETGHLVFGTLHTSSASKTVDRIINVFPTGQQAQIRTMLSESLQGVISQTLMKNTSGGRVAALEILLGTPAVSNLIREGKTFQIPGIMQTGKREGMQTMEMAVRALVDAGKVSSEEGKAYLPRPEANGNGNGARELSGIGR